MSFFHIRTLPSHPWPPLPDAAVGQVWIAYLELQQSQWLKPDELERRQLEQARSLLAHAIVHVPYYREVLPKAGIVPGAVRTMDDFRRIPLLPRRTYQEKLNSFVATRLPAGTVATDTDRTSGSSGMPTTVFRTNLSQLWWHAFFLRDLEWCNVDPTGTLAAIRATGKTGEDLNKLLRGVTVYSWSPPLEPLLQTGPAHGMDVRADHETQWQWLRRVAPDYLLSMPSNLEVLAGLARRDGPLPSLRAIQSIGNALTPEVRSAIEASFGVPVKDTYSCAEAGYLASPCPAGNGWHVHAENVIFELLDEHGQPCPPGQIGHVHITALHNLRGPFVRYELGDLARLGAEPCACGRGLPYLTSIGGRVSPMFDLHDGRRKMAAGLSVRMRHLPGQWQSQVVQKAIDHIVVRLAVTADWNEQHAAALRQTIQEFFEAPVRVDIETHERLPVPASGKFQAMINAIEAPEPTR